MLDILTPMGQQSLHDELIAKAIFEQNASGYTYLHTNKTGAATVDGIIVSHMELCAIVETKCRYNMDLDKFRLEFQSQWLVTKDKIDRARDIAEGLQTKLVGFLFIIPSQVLLVQRLWEPDKGWIVPMRAQRTTTQASINGGTAYRENYFIDMSSATLMEDQ